MGVEARLPVGRMDVCVRRFERSPEVLQWAREHDCQWNWRKRVHTPLRPAPEVGVGAQLPVGRDDHSS